MYRINFERYGSAAERAHPYIETGKVTRVIGNLIEGYTPGASVGSMCTIHRGDWKEPILAEIVGFRDKHILAMPLTDPTGISMGAKLTIIDKDVRVPVGEEFLGRVIDGTGRAMDGKGEIPFRDSRSIYSSPPKALDRMPVEHSLPMGVRSMDGFMTLGLGQRLGIFSGSGVGKSVLLGMLARNSQADVNVIALIGERGREVNEFINSQLGPEGLAKSVVVVVTSDESALLRRRGAFVATTFAEYFRSQGKSVLLMMDSVTRFAMAQREIGLAVGEPPTTKGYPPSVFGLLPKLLERSGNGTQQEGGGITGLYTVLVEGDEMDDPIADSVRSILDGHLILSRALAEKGHYPAIDVLGSVSRTMFNTVTPDHLKAAQKIRQWLAVYKRNEDLISVGAYVKGANAELDQAVEKMPMILNLLQQEKDERSTLEETVAMMNHLARGAVA